MASESKAAKRHRERQHKPRFGMQLNGKNIERLDSRRGRFVPFTTPRKPGQIYVYDRETGVQMRLETAQRRWPQHLRED